MVNLILTLISIALVAALVTATVNYLPWHLKPASDIAVSVRTSLVKVDAAFQAMAAMNNGVAPTPAGDPENAFQSTFVSTVLKFTPAAPMGYKWTYHQFSDPSNPGSKYTGLHYVCMEPTQPGPSDAALDMGLKRAKVTFSADQVILAESCGATSSLTSFTTQPVLTMYLVPSPEFVY